MDGGFLLSRQALAFLAVGEELHFGRAAQRLHVSQPPLSQQIRRFEDQVGTPLLVRNTRSVRLTPAGVRLLASLQAMRAQADLALTAARQAGRGESGTLALGFTSGAAYKVLPRVLAASRDRYPGVALALLHKESADLLDALVSERIDVALLRRHAGLDDPRLCFELVDSEPMIVALPAAHPLAGKRRIPVRALHGVDLVGFSATGSPYFHGLLERLFDGAGVRPRVVYESVMPTILSLVEAGAGIALVPESAAGMRPGGIAYRPLSGAGVATQSALYLAYRRGEVNAVVQRFAELVRANRTSNPQ
jgi:Transcriptional regulator